MVTGKSARASCLGNPARYQVSSPFPPSAAYRPESLFLSQAIKASVLEQTPLYSPSWFPLPSG